MYQIKRLESHPVRPDWFSRMLMRVPKEVYAPAEFSASLSSRLSQLYDCLNSYLSTYKPRYKTEKDDLSVKVVTPSGNIYVLFQIENCELN